jgi:hypothetical protein
MTNGEKAKDALADFATELLKLDMPSDCREGVEANLRLLASHARTLEAWLEAQAQ